MPVKKTEKWQISVTCFSSLANAAQITFQTYNKIIDVLLQSLI
jgi:hypothetical protein